MYLSPIANHKQPNWCTWCSVNMSMFSWRLSVCCSSRFQASAQCSFPAQSSESSRRHILRKPNSSTHRGLLPLAHPALSPPAGPQRQRHRWASNRWRVTYSTAEIGLKRVRHGWQRGGGGVKRRSSGTPQRLYPGEASLSDLLKHNNPCVSNTSLHAFRHPRLGVCLLYSMNVCVLQLQYPSKAPPLPTARTLALQASQAVSLHPQSLSFFTLHPVSFLSCLSLVFFPVCLSPDNSPLSTLFHVTPPLLSAPFSAPPPPVHLTPTHFPFTLHFSLLRSAASLTGNEKRFELTPVAAISVHLLASDGVELQVNEPITVSVPLPADSGLKENDHIPAWRFDPRFGMSLHEHKAFLTF